MLQDLSPSIMPAALSWETLLLASDNRTQWEVELPFIRPVHLFRVMLMPETFLMVLRLDVVPVKVISIKHPQSPQAR
jgi:hypothetical protein